MLGNPRPVPAKELLGKIDFGFIAIRQDEFRALLHFFPPDGAAKGRRTYELCTFQALDGSVYRAALLRSFEQGGAAAQAAASDVLYDLNPSWLVVVGIAGAVPDFEYGLGDVVVAVRLHDFCVTASVPEHITEVAARGGPAHRAVQDLAARLESLQPFMRGWNTPETLGLSRPQLKLCEENLVGDDGWKEKLRSTLTRRMSETLGSGSMPQAFDGAIVSANKLVKDPMTLQQWLPHARDLKAIEMELQGVYEAARSADGDRPVLAVRGISDIVGLKRDPEWTQYACMTAASFARSLLATSPISPRTLEVDGALLRPEDGPQAPRLSRLDELLDASGKREFRDRSPAPVEVATDVSPTRRSKKTAAVLSIARPSKTVLNQSEFLSGRWEGRMFSKLAPEQFLVCSLLLTTRTNGDCTGILYYEGHASRDSPVLFRGADHLLKYKWNEPVHWAAVFERGVHWTNPALDVGEETAKRHLYVWNCTIVSTADPTTISAVATNEAGTIEYSGELSRV